MKKILAMSLVFTMLAVLLLSSTAFAAGGLSAIQDAEDEAAMEAAIRATAELADEAEQMDTMKAEDKASLLDSVYRRRYHYDDIDGFKAMFADQYAKKSTYMNWAEGYPYLEGVDDTGATLVVKTDVDGWLYITSFGDNVAGGLSDEYSFMKFYNADNGEYKYKVWVNGGIEYKFSVASASWASGYTYRTYYCLSVNGNESGFGEAKFTVPKFWYTLRMQSIYYDDAIDYYFYLNSNRRASYYAHHYVPYDQTGTFDYYTIDYYDTPGTEVNIDYEYTLYTEVMNYVYTTITVDGHKFYDSFELPGPGIY